MVSELNDLHRRFNDNRVEIKMTVRSRNNQDGFSLPINSILLIIIGVLTYFFGWIVIVFVLAAAGLITLGTYIHDKIVGVPGLVVYGKFGADENYRPYGLSRDGKTCRSCKSPMFNVVHGQTRRNQIINFAKNSTTTITNAVTIEKPQRRYDNKNKNKKLSDRVVHP